MSWDGDCPEDREAIWALLLVCKGEYKRETHLEGTGNYPGVQFGCYDTDLYNR